LEKQTFCAKNPCHLGYAQYIENGKYHKLWLTARGIRLMKITSWCKTLKASLVAAGILLPSVALAINIPLGDPSFESYVVPASGYAYADLYHPTIPWVDDLDSPPGYTQDNASSAWLYNSTYAEDLTGSRPSPRTGKQAMHGLANYTAQKTSAVFEANKTYTFSIWAQNDEVLDNTNGLFMYIFDGTVPFSDANALAKFPSAVTAINHRTTGMTQAQSQANWTQVSISLFVPPGASEIGHQIGVGFFARRDTAVDDATLTATPEPSTIILVGMGMLGPSFLGRRRQRD
jgi:PEP-CTERM motif